MHGYKHILCALDLGDRSLQVGERAAALQKRFEAKLTLLHVVEEIDVGAGMEVDSPMPMETDSSLVQDMRRRLTSLATQVGVPKAGQVVVVSSSRGRQIKRVATEQGCDLIVVGSHGRHGMSLLFGSSTPNEVLHGATCDVLAVYIER